MTIDKLFFRQVLGHFATGVTVVTTKHEGTPAGLTVNAFCSVSLNPPLVLVCVDLNSSTLPVIRASQIFAVNMLTDEQEELSRCFATFSKERFDRFCDAPYHEAATGAPILDHSLAFVDTRVVAEYPGGDHIIFLGQVMAMGISDEAIFADETDRQQSTIPPLSTTTTIKEQSPLAYYRGQYRHLADKYQHSSLASSYDEATK